MRMVATKGLPYVEDKINRFPRIEPTYQLTEDILKQLDAKSHRRVSTDNGKPVTEVQSPHGVILIKHLP